MNSYERIYNILTENQNKDDSRLAPGHSKRMRDHEARIQRELLKPENQDDQSHSKETKEKASKVAKAREDAKRRANKVSEEEVNEVGDTAKGRERIRQALHNRHVDLEIAKSVQKDNPLGASAQKPHQLAKLVRGAAQGAKVSAYVSGREKGGHEGAMKAFRAVKKKHVKDTAATERKYGGGVPNVDKTGEPAGAGVRSATRNMTYRNKQIRRQVGEMTGAKGNPSASRGISTPPKRPSGYGQTERPSDARIQALKDRVSAHFKANPDAEGAESHKEKGSTWKERPRKKSEK